MKIHRVGADLFYVDRPDVTRLIVGFPNFANVPKNALPGYLRCVTMPLHQRDTWPTKIKSVKIHMWRTDQISTAMLQNPYH